jgi:hypothetical protein
MPIASLGEERIRTISTTSDLQASIALVNLVDREYTVGDEFQYDVEITNTSGAMLQLPWSANPEGLTDVADAQAFEASLSLTIANGSNQERVLTGVSMYGRPDIPSSTLTLAPGMSARIHAAGAWTVAGVRMSVFVAPQNGRMSLRAVYRLQRGTTLASTAPSASQGLTLRMPHH